MCTATIWALLSLTPCTIYITPHLLVSKICHRRKKNMKHLLKTKFIMTALALMVFPRYRFSNYKYNIYDSSIFLLCFRSTTLFFCSNCTPIVQPILKHIQKQMITIVEVCYPQASNYVKYSTLRNNGNIINNCTTEVYCFAPFFLGNIFGWLEWVIMLKTEKEKQYDNKLRCCFSNVAY